MGRTDSSRQRLVRVVRLAVLIVVVFLITSQVDCRKHASPNHIENYIHTSTSSHSPTSQNYNFNSFDGQDKHQAKDHTEAYVHLFRQNFYKQNAIPFNDDFIVIEAKSSLNSQEDLGEFDNHHYEAQSDELNEGHGNNQNIYGKNLSYLGHANNHGNIVINELDLDKKEADSNKDLSSADREYYAQLAKNISFIISPILLILGGIGNPLCIIVLTRKNKNPTIIYLCVLAAFDILVLYSGLLRNYLNELFGYDVRNLSSFTCKFHIFITYTFMEISSYILVAVTLNRFTIMFNRTIFCRPKMLKRTKQKPESLKGVVIIVTSITMIVSLMNLHFLIYYENIGSPAPTTVASTLSVNSQVSPTTSGDPFLAPTTTTAAVQDALLLSSANSLANQVQSRTTEAPPVLKMIQTKHKCTISRGSYPQYFEFRVKIFPKLHLYLFIVLPCCILFIMNTLIIRKIMISSKGSMLGRGHGQGADNNRSKSKDLKKKEKKRTALSIMLVSVCLWFMILKTPASVYLTFPEDEENKPHFPLTYNIFMLINYTNHAVNLILYIAISSSFREEFKEYFIAIRNRFCKPKRHHHHHTNNQPSYSCSKSNCNNSVALPDNNNNNNIKINKEKLSNALVQL